MFEAKPPKAPDQRVRNQHADHRPADAGRSAAGEGLLAVDWADLRARLAAARELRATLLADAAGRQVTDCSSFDALCAGQLTALGQGSPPDGQSAKEFHCVNPNPSINGKANQGKTDPTYESQEARGSESQ